MCVASFHLKGMVAALIAILIACFPFRLAAQEVEKAGTSLSSLRLELDVQKRKLALPFEELNQLYRSQLEKLEEAVQREGNLDRLVAVQKELKTFSSEGTGEAKDFPQLKKLQDIYRDESAKRKEAATKQQKPLIEDYLKKLNALETQLTKEGQVKDALEVRKEKETAAESIAKLAIAGEVSDGGISPRASDGGEGKLAGFGMGDYSDPLSGGTARSYKDMVAVKLWEPKGQRNGWVGLRANGSVVTHLDRRASPTKDTIRDFACSDNGGIIMIREDGSLNTDLCQFPPPGNLKDRLTDVIDVAMGSDTGIAGDEAVVVVRKNGSLAWWGPGTEKSGVEGPPGDARMDMIAVEGSWGPFHVLKKDGSLVAWNFKSGGDGRLNLPENIVSRRFKELAVGANHTLGPARLSPGVEMPTDNAVYRRIWDRVPRSE